MFSFFVGFGHIRDSIELSTNRYRTTTKLIHPLRLPALSFNFEAKLKQSFTKKVASDLDHWQITQFASLHILPWFTTLKLEQLSVPDKTVNSGCKFACDRESHKNAHMHSPTKVPFHVSRVVHVDFLLAFQKSFFNFFKLPWESPFGGRLRKGSLSWSCLSAFLSSLSWSCWSAFLSRFRGNFSFGGQRSFVPSLRRSSVYFGAK